MVLDVSAAEEPFLYSIDNVFVKISGIVQGRETALIA